MRDIISNCVDITGWVILASSWQCLINATAGTISLLSFNLLLVRKHLLFKCTCVTLHLVCPSCYVDLRSMNALVWRSMVRRTFRFGGSLVQSMGATNACARLCPKVCMDNRWISLGRSEFRSRSNVWGCFVWFFYFVVVKFCCCLYMISMWHERVSFLSNNVFLQIAMYFVFGKLDSISNLIPHADL